MSLEKTSWAEEWIAAWNSGPDLDAVLRHYSNDIEFISPVARQTVGQAGINGKAELQSYWERAIEQIGHIRFRLIQSGANETGDSLFVLYEAQLGDARKLACEVVWLDDDGLASRSMALYGANLSESA